MEVEIYADERENAEVRKKLERLGAKVHVKVLPVADFILSGRCACERKTRADFENSVIDGRLFTQAKHLCENFARPVVIVEGTGREERISRAALLGAYAALITDYGISLFFSKSPSASAEILFAIAKHEQLVKKHPLRVHAKRKALSLQEQQLAVIESLPMVGPGIARKLLSSFGSIENIVNASEKELAEVEKLGKKRARIIRKILSAVYSEEGGI